MKTGTVKWFNSRKGYGVIMPVDGGFNVYVDIKAIERAGLAELKEGWTVHFDNVSDNRTGEIFAENLSIPLSGQEDVAGRAVFLGYGGRSRWSSFIHRAVKDSFGVGRLLPAFLGRIKTFPAARSSFLPPGSRQSSP